MINLYKTLFLFEWFLGKIMIFLFKKVSVLNWEIFSLLSAKFLGIAGARRKGRWAIWNFLPFVIFTWAFFLVCCLPKECFSQERPEEQRGRTCSVGEKALMWSVSGDHRQGSSMIEKKKKKKKSCFWWPQVFFQALTLAHSEPEEFAQPLNIPMFFLPM